MNVDGGCCIANYGGGGGGGERLYMHGMSKVDRIMLKFRPIVPKPVAPGSSSGGSGPDNSNRYVNCVRSKRKYVRVKKSKNNNFKRRGVKVKVEEAHAVTLPLLPETPDRKENKPVTGFSSDLLSPVNFIDTVKFKNNKSNSKKILAAAQTPTSVWLRFDSLDQVRVRTDVTKPLLPPPRLPQLVSYVTVECVTETWVDSEALGCTDEEIMINMEKDTCPGFISDGQDKVVWTNTAYTHMIDDDDNDNDVAVALVWKDKPVVTIYPAFTCKVRVTFAAQSHRKTNFPTLTLPCDVWRMKMGTYAWRLDVKAALSLGR